MSDDYDDIDSLIDNDPIELGARCRKAESVLADCVKVLEAVLPYVTGYDAVPYQDALWKARVALHLGESE